MKKLLLILTVGLLSITAKSQSDKTFFYSTKWVITDPITDKSETLNGEAKISIDYDLKIIKIILITQELVYSFYNVEQINMGNERWFFELDKGQSFVTMMVSIEKDKNYIMFSPKDPKTMENLIFMELQLLH